MPRHDYYDDDTMTRDRSREDRDYRDRDRYRARAMFRDDRGGEAGGSMDSRMREYRRGRDPRFGSDAYSRDIPMDETRRLIASNKVEGTPVYDRNGDRCGSIHNFMVDKRKGQVRYAVLKHSSGFLGFDERYYPLQWDELTYDTDLDGYHIDMSSDELMRRGSFNSEGRWSRGRDRDHDRDRMRSAGDRVAYDYRSDDYRR